jgi:hypothetical protein
LRGALVGVHLLSLYGAVKGREEACFFGDPLLWRGRDLYDLTFRGRFFWLCLRWRLWLGLWAFCPLLVAFKQAFNLLFTQHRHHLLTLLRGRARWGLSQH